MLLTCISGNSQIHVADTYLLSPSASNLGEYGEVPVSFYTGLPQIEVPIYTIAYGRHKLPITLTYHGGGVRPDQHPGWTGIGWSLNAGGCISRIVKTYPDESKIRKNGNIQNIIERGYLYSHMEWTSGNVEQNINSIINSAIASSQPVPDLEPDKFSFNFCGITGNFYLNSKGEWLVQSNKEIYIEVDSVYAYRFQNIRINIDPSTDLHPQYIRYFKLTDENGTKYTFGEDEQAIEFSFNYFNQSKEEFVATTWHLKRIEYTDGRVFEFYYKLGEYVAQFGQSRTNFMLLIDQDNIAQTNEIKELTYSGTLVMPSYLSKITFGEDSVCFETETSNGLTYDLEKIDPISATSIDKAMDIYQYLLKFDPKTNKIRNGQHYTDRHSFLEWKKLTKIKVYRGQDNEVIRQFRLNYNDTITSGNKLRLALTSFVDCSSSVEHIAYQFEYSDLDKLPNYFADKNDHWGYFNNIECNVPIENTSTYEYCRRPNATSMKYGLLTKITYPTQGYTRFEYEPHDYRKMVDIDSINNVVCKTLVSDQLAGGLRIHKIINSSTGNIEDEITSKEYSYIDMAGASSGILMSPVKYKTDLIVEDATGQLRQSYVCSSQTILPMSINSSGTHIGYSRVVETYPDSSMTIFTYTNFDTNPDENYIYSNQPFVVTSPRSSQEQQRGLLISQIDYDSSGLKTREVIHRYQINGEESDSEIKNIYNRFFSVSYPSGTIIDFAVESVAYINYVYSMRRYQTQVTDYKSNQPYKTLTTRYMYNRHKLVERVIQNLNNNQTIRTIYTYPFDNTSNSACVEMTKKHILSPVLSETQELLVGSSTYPISRKVYRYNDKGFPIRISVYEKDSLASVYNYEYDCYCNPIVERINQHKINSYIWSYDGRYIVAKIENKYYKEIQYYDGWLNDIARMTNPNYDILNGMRTEFPHIQISTYEYIPLIGVSKHILPNGQCINYEYDAYGRLTFIRDIDGNIIESYQYNYSPTE